MLLSGRGIAQRAGARAHASGRNQRTARPTAGTATTMAHGTTKGEHRANRTPAIGGDAARRVAARIAGNLPYIFLFPKFRK